MSTKSLDELAGVCRGLIADGRITSSEFEFLNEWLADCPFRSDWPASEIADLIQDALRDRKISATDRTRLLTLLERIYSTPFT
ncbi:MAG: hypothetical protein KDN22_30240 [Verrucomicrobiae bacterium]|nr:hypothetical protein [Verrucomicrobiae bacterium]